MATNDTSTFAAETIISDLQNAIRGKLAADTYLSGIDIFTPDDVSQDGTNKLPADIEERINQALSSLKKGLCIIVALPVIDSISPDSPGIYADKVPVLIRVVENPQVNRGVNGTNIKRTMATVRIMLRLQHFTYRDCTVIVERAKRVPDNKALIWDIQARTALNIPALDENGE